MSNISTTTQKTINVKSLTDYKKNDQRFPVLPITPAEGEDSHLILYDLSRGATLNGRGNFSSEDDLRQCLEEMGVNEDECSVLLQRHSQNVAGNSINHLRRVLSSDSVGVAPVQKHASLRLNITFDTDTREFVYTTEVTFKYLLKDGVLLPGTGGILTEEVRLPTKPSEQSKETDFYVREVTGTGFVAQVYQQGESSPVWEDKLSEKTKTTKILQRETLFEKVRALLANLDEESFSQSVYLSQAQRDELLELKKQGDGDESIKDLQAFFRGLSPENKLNNKDSCLFLIMLLGQYQKDDNRSGLEHLWDCYESIEHGLDNTHASELTHLRNTVKIENKRLLTENILKEVSDAPLSIKNTLLASDVSRLVYTRENYEIWYLLCQNLLSQLKHFTEELGDDGKNQMPNLEKLLIELAQEVERAGHKEACYQQYIPVLRVCVGGLLSVIKEVAPSDSEVLKAKKLIAEAYRGKAEEALSEVSKAEAYRVTAKKAFSEVSIADDYKQTAEEAFKNRKTIFNELESSLVAQKDQAVSAEQNHRFAFVSAILRRVSSVFDALSSVVRSLRGQNTAQNRQESRPVNNQHSSNAQSVCSLARSSSEVLASLVRVSAVPEPVDENEHKKQDAFEFAFEPLGQDESTDSVLPNKRQEERDLVDAQSQRQDGGHEDNNSAAHLASFGLFPVSGESVNNVNVAKNNVALSVSLPSQ